MNILKKVNQSLLFCDEVNIFADPKEGILGKEATPGAALWLLLDQAAKCPNILVIGTARICHQATTST